MKKLFLLALLSQALFSPGIELQAADSKTAKKAAKKPAAKTAKSPNNITPTHKNVKYGAHQKELVNFWQVESKEPLGLLLDIHGGGWMGGKKAETELMMPGAASAVQHYSCTKHRAYMVTLHMLYMCIAWVIHA